MPSKKAPCFLQEFSQQLEYMRCTAALARKSSSKREKLLKSVVENFLAHIGSVTLTFQEAKELTTQIQQGELPDEVRSLATCLRQICNLFINLRVPIRPEKPRLFGKTWAVVLG